MGIDLGVAARAGAVIRVGIGVRARAGNKKALTGGGEGAGGSFRAFRRLYAVLSFLFFQI